MRKLHRSIVAIVCGGALFTAGVALASNPNHPNHGHGTTTGTTTGTTSTNSLPSQAKAYGVYCQSQSKVHVAGQKGTPFSQCVTAMAKAAHGASGKAACAAMSKTHVEGQKGSPYSQCVSAAAQLHKDQQHGKSNH
jgi:hypothetical protein